MKMTDRERIVLLLLPVAVILAGYAWWFNIFYRHKVQAAERDYAVAVAAQVKPLDLMAQRAGNAKTQREVADLEKQKAKLEGQAAALCGKTVIPAERIHADSQLVELLRRHQLQVIEAGPAVKGGEAKLPKSLVEAIGRLGSASHDKTGQVRCLRLTGRFMDVLLAVQELSQTEASPVIPISLTMAEADLAADARQWTLLVWM